MSNNIRQYLLNELGVDEAKELSNISKYVRATTKLNDLAKCNCCVCKARSKQFYPKDKNAQNIYNHHVMKVEYLAILVDAYDLCYLSKKNINVNKARVNDYTYAPGFRPYSPRVAVCDLHHTMFHELVGDNDIKKIKDITIDEAENIVEVFEDYNDVIKRNCEVYLDDEENVEGYKTSYQGVWDETLIKSLIRLSNVLEVNELKYQSDEFAEFYPDEDPERYENLLAKIDTIIRDTLNYDNENDIQLPEVDFFTLEELDSLEGDLTKYSNLISKKSNKTSDKITNVKTEINEDELDILDVDLSDLSLEDLEEIQSELEDDIDNGLEA